jgi:hypothetical protein
MEKITLKELHDDIFHEVRSITTDDIKAYYMEENMFYAVTEFDDIVIINDDESYYLEKLPFCPELARMLNDEYNDTIIEMYSFDWYGALSTSENSIFIKGRLNNYFHQGCFEIADDYYNDIICNAIILID